MGVVCRFCGKQVGMVGAVPRSANRRGAPKAVKAPMPSQPSWNGEAYNGKTWAQHWGEMLHALGPMRVQSSSFAAPSNLGGLLTQIWPQGPYQMILAVAPTTYDTQLHEAAMNPWPELKNAVMKQVLAYSPVSGQEIQYL